MTREISQRELRNDNASIMRELEAGERFVLTRNGTPIGELAPLARPRSIATAELVRAMREAPRLDAEALRRDLDAVASQDPHPRG